MKFIGGLSFILIQIYSLQALDIENESEDSQLNSKKSSSLRSNCSYSNNPQLNIENYSLSDVPCGSITSPAAGGKLQILEEQVNELKERIEEIKKSPNIDNCKRESNLETAEVKRFQKLVDDVNEEIWEEIKIFKEHTEVFLGAIVCHKKKLGDVQQLFKRKVQERLQVEIIQQIEAGNYNDALKKLQDLEGELKKNINNIVHKVYNNTSNFELIWRFGDASDNQTVSLAVYQALNLEMENKGHKDYKQILKLINSVNRNIINGIHKFSSEVDEGESLKNNLHSLAKDVIVQELIKVLPDNDYQTVSNISKEIDTYYPILFREVISEAVNSTGDKINVEDLVKYFMNHDRPKQSVVGYSAIFNSLKNRNSLDQPATVTLAFGLKKTLEEEDRESHSEAKELMAALPKSVKNLIFSKKVCFKNIVNNEYMYAASNGFNYDKDRRRVFSWRSHKRVLQGLWIVFINGDTYEIYNTDHKEYLYAANDGFAYNEDRRSVFTWGPGNPVIESKWIFVPEGDNVYIKNTRFNEYLIADDEVAYDSDRRYVFTWRRKSITANSLWAVEDCSNVG